MSTLVQMMGRCITDPKIRFAYLSRLGLYNSWSDERYIKKEFYLNMGKELDLKNPITFNEKLQWLKLYDRKPIYTTMVDKYAAKKYVADLIGEEYIIPTLGVWNTPDEIDFESLPRQFVLKTTHDSGGIVICKDKSKLNFKDAKSKLWKSLKRDYYLVHREWPYKNVPKKIIGEKYMEDNDDKELRDYKFYCFNGKVQALLLATNRQSKEEPLCFDYYDNKFEHLNMKNHWHPNSRKKINKPQKFEEMVELASELSKGIPHIRVDFYEVNGKVYFGELTFFDMGGYLIIYPQDWDVEWGKLIDLSLALGERCI